MLITICKIITAYICASSATGIAYISCCGFTVTTVFKLLNLITWGCFGIPFINNGAIVYCSIKTVFAFFLFTSNGYEGHKGNSNGEFFHNG